MKRSQSSKVINLLVTAASALLVFLILKPASNQTLATGSPADSRVVEVPALPIQTRDAYAAVFSSPLFSQDLSGDGKRPDIRALGRVETPDRTMALVQFHMDEHARALAVGQVHRGWTLTDIAETHILLRGASVQRRIPFIKITEQRDAFSSDTASIETQDADDVLDAVKDILNETSEDSY